MAGLDLIQQSSGLWCLDYAAAAADTSPIPPSATGYNQNTQWPNKLLAEMSYSSADVLTS